MTTTTAERGYSPSKKQVNTRLARIEGQVRGLQKMVDDDRYCIDVLTQITAVQAALDKVALGLLADHADHCIVHGHGGKSPQENSEELMAAVARLVKR